MTHLFARLGVAIILALGGLVAIPAVTQAATAPSCLFLFTHTSNLTLKRYTTVENHCAGYQRFRIIWAGAVDSSCIGLNRDGTHEEWRGIYNYVTELRAC